MTLSQKRQQSLYRRNGTKSIIAVLTIPENISEEAPISVSFGGIQVYYRHVHDDVGFSDKNATFTEKL